MGLVTGHGELLGKEGDDEALLAPRPPNKPLAADSRYRRMEPRRPYGYRVRFCQSHEGILTNVPGFGAEKWRASGRIVFDFRPRDWFPRLGVPYRTENSPGRLRTVGHPRSAETDGRTRPPETEKHSGEEKRERESPAQELTGQQPPLFAAGVVEKGILILCFGFRALQWCA